MKGEKRSGPEGARPHRPALPGLRRHRARGQLRRHLAAVLPDLPDRRQAAGRPADVQAAALRTEDDDGPMLVTFDLFSALIDSRTGGSAVLGRLAAERGWAGRRRAALRRVGPPQQGLAARRARVDPVRRALPPGAGRDLRRPAAGRPTPTADAACSTARSPTGRCGPDVAAQLPELARPAPRRRPLQRGRRDLRPHAGRGPGRRRRRPHLASGCAPTSRRPSSTSGRGSGPAAS